MVEITNLNQYRKKRKMEEKRKARALNNARMNMERLGDRISAERRELEQDGKKFIDRARSKDKDTD